MNYFRAKPEFIIGSYVIARETAQLAMKYPLLSVFQPRISLWVLWIVFYSPTFIFMLSC